MTALTAGTSLGEWLADPAGQPLLSELLARMGADPTQLGPVSGLPLEQIVPLSRGALTVEDVESLVRAANDGELVVAEAVNQTAPVPIRADLTLADIQIRDPFVLRDGDAYVLYGSTDPNIWFGPGVGFDAYRSADLSTWEGPFPAFRPPAGFWSPGMYWAPEVHEHAGRWYMFATFTAEDGYRGTQILVADDPLGPFEPWSDGAVTPRKWQCLDGTLFVDEAGDPWIVFCQEWTQVHDGAVWAQRLTADLRAATGVPVFLFNASDAPWARPIPETGRGDSTFASYVTDGPFLFRLDDGILAMLWSSHGDQGYAMGIARSASGDVTGPWVQDERPIWSADGGHGMVFRRSDGQLMLTLHQPNNTPFERATLHRLIDGPTVTIAGVGA